MDSVEIEKIARQNLADAYVEYPMGCGQEEMKAFLSTRPFADVSYAILTSEDIRPLIDKHVS